MKFLEEIWQFLILHQKDLPALLTGIIGGVLLSLLGAGLYSRSRHASIRVDNAKLKGAVQQQAQTIAEQSKQLSQLEKESHDSREKADRITGIVEAKTSLIDGLTSANETLKEESLALSRRHRRLRRRHAAIKSEVAELTHRLDTMDKSDGRIWNKPILGAAPAFRPLALRHTPIISVVNLKGGVGKTTITANLGAAFASLRRRVLLVDLDHQGSLTARCIGRTEDFIDARKARRLIDDVLQDGDVALNGFHRSVIRLRDSIQGSMFLLGADDKFADFEMRLMERWLSRSTADDVRYRLRRVLHDPSVATSSTSSSSTARPA